MAAASGRLRHAGRRYFARADGRLGGLEHRAAACVRAARAGSGARRGGRRRRRAAHGRQPRLGCRGRSSTSQSAPPFGSTPPSGRSGPRSPTSPGRITGSFGEPATGRSVLSARTTVHYIVPGWATQQAQSGIYASWANQELQDFTSGIYDARETALGRMSAEARRQGAAGVVGVSIVHHIEEREAGAGSGRKDLVDHLPRPRHGDRRAQHRRPRARGLPAARPEQGHTSTAPSRRKP